jgi:hypothetical protein
MSELLRDLHSSINYVSPPHKYLLQLQGCREQHTKWLRGQQMFSDNNKILDTNAITMLDFLTC